MSSRTSRLARAAILLGICILSVRAGFASSVPMIQSAAISPQPATQGPCDTWLVVTITGENVLNGTILANGTPLSMLLANPNIPNVIYGAFPEGWISAPGKLSFVVTSPDSATKSAPFAFPAFLAPELALCPIEPAPVVFPSTQFSLFVQPTAVNVTGNGTVTLGSLPPGFTTSHTTVPLTPVGAQVILNAAANVPTNYPANSISLPFEGTWSGVVVKGNFFSFEVGSGKVPALSITPNGTIEVGVPIGGSGQIQFDTFASGVDYDFTPSVSGLPKGVTATFWPPIVPTSQQMTVTLNASPNATLAKNLSVTLSGKPFADTPAVSTQFLVDVSEPPGHLPGSRTDFVSTAGTPYSAVYDAKHNLIFASNPSWNRIDVISNRSHKIIKSIPIRTPSAIDITPDNTHVWVQAVSKALYEIDTSTLQAATYTLPNYSFGSGADPNTGFSNSVLALADETLFLSYGEVDAHTGRTVPIVGIWNPKTGQLDVLNSTTVTWGPPARSGDGKHVFAIYSTETGPGNYGSAQLADYTTETGQIRLQSTNYQGFQILAVNGDGTKLALLGTNGPGLFDADLKLLGELPSLKSSAPQQGGAVFSADDSKLYVMGMDGNLAVVYTMDAATLEVLATAPAAPSHPISVEDNYSSHLATPFAADRSGMVLGIQNYGISFDDAEFAQHYAAIPPGYNGTTVYYSSFAGPLKGRTTSTLNIEIPATPDYCTVFTPDVWFGQRRGKATLDGSCGAIHFTSPPTDELGPVNVKFINPDGDQWFFPLLYSYSTYPEYAVTSGSSPEGGGAASVIGFGLPQDPSSGTVRVGDNAATITNEINPGAGPPFSGEPVPSTVLDYTFPPGKPGWADLTVTSANGTGVLPKSIFYAKSVTDHASKDKFSAVLVDEARSRVYLSAGDHVDVFSTKSNAFVAPLHPAAQTTYRQFEGLALTPDGSNLLVADLYDHSLAVIDPDQPANTFAIPLGPAHAPAKVCPTGPLYVAAAANGMALVTEGSESSPGASCDPAGVMYSVNLAARTAVKTLSIPPCMLGDRGGFEGLSVDATNDGSYVAIGAAVFPFSGNGCLYSAKSSTYAALAPQSVTAVDYFSGYGIAISGDGNVIGSFFALVDTGGDLLGTIATPYPLYRNADNGQPPGFWVPPPLMFPRLNASGSLYYFAYPNYIEIMDVAHALLRLRFALTETVQNTAAPIAIDSGGQFVYLITDKGLTVVDFGAAPLSIGHLSLASAQPGTKVQVRGSGFESGMTTTIGHVAAHVNVTDQNTMTLTVPAAMAGPQDIVLKLTNGETYTLENGITVL